ncbi:MAG: 2OG-Fe(II) oxygenase [Arenicellales bacterium]|nr:2OG-Fe(II) oxygenase [Arenicellales bacterium]
MTSSMSSGDDRILWANRINQTYPGLSSLCSDPPIFRIDGFLEAKECDALIALGSGRTVRSPTLDDKAVAGGISEARTSTTCFLRQDEAPWLIEKAANLTNKPPTHMETPQVCHYEPGAYYHAHHDGVDMTGAVGKLWAANGGQRLVTLLIYINDVARGGKTLFNELNLYSKPQKGTALLFFPAFGNGEMDRRVLHEADTVIDEKWVIQIWIRQSRWRVEKEPISNVSVSSQEVMYY